MQDAHHTHLTVCTWHSRSFRIFHL